MNGNRKIFFRYDTVNREALWRVLRMYDVGGQLLSGIKSIYVNSSACFRIKGGKREWFRKYISVE